VGSALRKALAPREESPGIHVVGSRGKGGLVNQKANDRSGREGGEGDDGGTGIRDCGPHQMVADRWRRFFSSSEAKINGSSV